MTDFKGKTVLITGASRGLGEAIALDMAAKGAHILACARDSDALTQLGEKLSSRATVWAEDATDDALLHRIESAPRIDILVNNLGTNRPKPIAQVSDDDLDIMLNMNLRAAYRITRAVLKVMPDGGNIINMSSQMGHVGAPNRTVYCMTKHGLTGVTKALAVEYARFGVTAHTILPGWVETGMTETTFAWDKFVDNVMPRIPMRRWGQPEDFAGIAVYIMSDASRYHTSETFLIDGGYANF